MSEQEEIKLFSRISEGIQTAQRRLFERKAKLGEPVIVADADGQPVRVSAEDAMRRLDRAAAEPETKTI